MEIQPFRIRIPQTALDDLHNRLAHTNWPSQLPVTDDKDWQRGVPVAYLNTLSDYWRTGFDWRAQEAELNKFPQFMTEIDGQSIHFLHVRSSEPNALPLLILHGYPSSFVEFTKIIGPLADPRAYGADPSQAFHVIVPSLPGYGFSTPLAESGWELSRTSRALAALMYGLGYERYLALGSDIGAGIVGMLGSTDGDHLIAAHVSTDPTALALLGAPIAYPAGDSVLSQAQIQRLQGLRELQNEGKGYLQIQSTKPQTLAYALADSPVAQLAWIVEKFEAWTNIDKLLPEDAVDRDQLLTNVSLYWFTGTGATAANFIYEATHSTAPWAAASTTPTGFAAFNIRHIENAMRAMVDPEHKLPHWSAFEQGGHFPAMEAPDLLMNDAREFFRQFR
ncbi:MAG: epoxide hydrolase [Anaerolineae bacterium]|nr:epoxide hydrolase [Anaerolineae bacterium]